MIARDRDHCGEHSLDHVDAWFTTRAMVSLPVFI